MICKADFEELFPDLFQPEPASATPEKAKPVSAACIARPEGDGAPILHARQDRRISLHCPEMPVSARSGAMTATMPATAAIAAAWTMLSAYGSMARQRHGRL